MVNNAKFAWLFFGTSPIGLTLKLGRGISLNGPAILLFCFSTFGFSNAERKFVEIRTFCVPTKPNLKPVIKPLSKYEFLILS